MAGQVLVGTGHLRLPLSFHAHVPCLSTALLASTQQTQLSFDGNNLPLTAVGSVSGRAVYLPLILIWRRTKIQHQIKNMVPSRALSSPGLLREWIQVCVCGGADKVGLPPTHTPPNLDQEQ